MDEPTLFKPYAAAPDIDVLPSYFPIPVLGLIPVNAFLIKATEPVLVDTGLIVLCDGFMKNLSSLIDPESLRWLWLTHTDQDHIGSLQRILDEAPHVRIITTFMGLGKMSLFNPLPLDRVYLLNPGQQISVGDRTLTAVKPPCYDSPETTGAYDDKSGVFFSADCFGALMSEPVENAADIGSSKLKEGMTTWATIDSPWLHSVDRGLFSKAIDHIRKISPEMILSAHLPAARGMTDILLEHLASVPDMPPFIGMDQMQLEEMIRELGGY